MRTSSNWRLPLVILATFFVLVFGNAATGYAYNVEQATLQPTETSVPIVTSTSVPSATPATIAAVDWSDLSVYKRAMKPGFESDVDRFANANRYLIVANLKIETDAIIRGAERVRFTNHTADTLKEIVFRLYPNAPVLAGRMDISHVTLEGRPVEPSFSDLNSVMTIPLQTPLAQGASVEMTVDFTVVMTRELNASYGRFGYLHNVVSATAWYPTLSVYDEGLGWWKTMPSPAGDPAYTETGLYDVRLTLPGDMTVAMSGVEIETVKNNDGTVMHRSVTGPMRDHAWGASTRYQITSREVDGTKINVVYYKDPKNPQADGTQDALKYASQSLRAFNATFGDYPFREFNVLENPTPTGVEFPGLVQIAEREWEKGNRELEITVAHETGHQWFYSLIGDNQVEHPWLDEGLTTYTEFVYVRTYYPEDRAEDYIERRQRAYQEYIGKGKPDLPVDAPVGSFTSGTYGLIVYQKGALFMIELERQLGRETVLKALREYFRRYKYAVVTSADLQHTFEDVTGKDLSDLFHKWLGDYAELTVKPRLPNATPTATS